MKYLLLLFLLGSCMGKDVPEPFQDSAPAATSANLRYMGKYANRCHGCPQGPLSLQISENFTYSISGHLTAIGTYRWSAGGRYLLLSRKGLPQIRLSVLPDALVFESTKDTLYKLPETRHANMEIPEIPAARWTLVELNGKATRKIQQEDPFMTVSADRSFTAYAGCNSIGGKFTIKGSQIEFAEVIQTEMACADANLEGPLVQALTAADNFIVNGKMLQLRKGQSVIAKFEALPVPEKVR